RPSGRDDHVRGLHRECRGERGRGRRGRPRPRPEARRGVARVQPPAPSRVPAHTPARARHLRVLRRAAAPIGGMGWADWVRGFEVEPSIYAADFAHLAEQLELTLDAGVRVFHYDVGDGHFVEPITTGPIVLEAIAELVHERGAAIDCHLMVDNPARHVPQMARAGGDSVTFHVEVGPTQPVIELAREHGLGVGVAFNPGTAVADAARAAEGADVVLCMSIWPGYSGQPFMPEAIPRVRELRG